MTTLCDVPWCLCAAVKKGVCAVHYRYGRQLQPLPITEDDREDCDTCNGDGCPECEGSGDHACGCGDEHECHECGGTGECPDCHQSNGPKGPTLTRDERAYLAWALSAGADPCPPFFTITRRS